ncbi:MAG: double-strand break repair protein AddB [Telmatospirillum sp.]|nr:double-strand break repair protein AddB [Telmatospirillum sp.]
MTAAAPKLFDIPAGTPFLAALASGIRSELGSDPLALSRATVLLPNRRAVRALGEAFLAAGDGAALLLPRIAAIGDVDEDELTLAAETASLAAELPPAIDALARHLLLARLVAARGDLVPTPAAAFKLAEALASLLDEMQIEEVGFERFADLVPADYAAHWGETLAFLDILREAWPKILASRGEMDGQARRAKLIRALAAHWARIPPAGPIWAAGSTGSVPATAHLLATIARLASGAVVLPGLDRTADAATWEAIGEDPSHPQYGLNLLLRRMEATRADVRDWPGTLPGPRASLVASVLLPAPATESWRDMPAFAPEAFAGLKRLEAPDSDSEAGAIALLLRETLETPGRTAALVTADRNLARRVAAELKRWNVTVDDTAGLPLARTAPATLLRLAAHAANEEFAPVPLLALLKHPLVQLGQTRSAHLARTRSFERDHLRGPRPAPGLAGLQALEADNALLAALAAAFAEATTAGETLPELLPAFLAAAEALARDETGQTRLWDGDAGEAAAAFAARLAEAADAFGPLKRRHFADFLDTVLATEAYRPPYGGHPRLAIRGTLEARLVAADRVVLGGLNEGVWPGEAREDPWLSRPMRKATGLPPPERQIGLAAHDFAQALAGADVVLSRARKAEGTPTLPARWLLRFEALVGKDNPQWQGLLWQPPLGWARLLAGSDEKGRMLAKPRPAPPVSVRPAKLAVTGIETLVRDPYAIYARYVLRLRPLDPIDADVDARDRGNMIHEALENFAKRFPGELPKLPEAELVEIGRQIFAKHLDRPAVAAFWWPRFVRIAEWFAALQTERQADGFRIAGVECAGELDLGGFTLTARADRIDRGPDGRLVVIDYKTGSTRTAKQVLSGIAPQLPLTAAVAKAGAFAGIPAAAIGALVYAKLGGAKQAGDWQTVAPGKEIADADAFADEALARLRALLQRYGDPAQPYLSRPRPQFVSHAGDYDHLARWLEWSRDGDDE